MALAANGGLLQIVDTEHAVANKDCRSLLKQSHGKSKSKSKKEEIVTPYSVNYYGDITD